VRIAIVGGGIAGLVAAYHLSRRHEVTVFEAEGYAGGHTNTVDVELGDERHRIDTGFIVFNHRTYPQFTRLLEGLGVATQPTTMSFSVHCERTAFEYNGTSLNGLFAQRGNLLRPSFYRMLRDIARFNRRGPDQVARLASPTVGAFLEASGYGPEFRDRYLVPMGAAIWSCPPHTFLDFPMPFVIDFFRNHGMLQVHHRPVWRVVTGGSASYVDALTRSFAGRIRLGCPVRAVRRGPDAVCIRLANRVESFDEVVLACHSDQALALLEDPLADERRLLSAFPYQANDVVLHTDTRMLPRRPLAWAAWNYRIPATPGQTVNVTYNMNILQQIRSRHTFCVSLNPGQQIAEETVLRRFTYHHPVYTVGRDEAARQHHLLIRRNRTSFCGAYWGFGFHEDGVRSALAVASAYGEVH
jgi:predicted NAD/FAD-binding protein